MIFTNSSLPTCPLREEKSFSQRFFSIYTDIRKLQDKAKTSYTLSTRRPQFDYECRSFPSLYRKKRQSFTALFMDGNLPRPLGSRQLYLCRDLTPARFISGSSSALRAPDGRSHQRNFHLIIYNGRRLPHRLPGSRTFRPFSRNPL